MRVLLHSGSRKHSYTTPGHTRLRHHKTATTKWWTEVRNYGNVKTSTKVANHSHVNYQRLFKAIGHQVVTALRQLPKKITIMFDVVVWTPWYLLHATPGYLSAVSDMCNTKMILRHHWLKKKSPSRRGCKLTMSRSLPHGVLDNGSGYTHFKTHIILGASSVTSFCNH